MLPVLGREVVEGKQRVAILDQALDSLVVFDAPGFDEGVERGECILLGLGHPDLLERTLGLRLLALGQLVQDLAVLCTQQRWPRVLGHPSSTACQKPRAPSATASSGPIASPRRLRSRRSSFHDCALSRTPSMSPTSSFLPSGVAPMITSRHCAASLEPGLHMDAVDPEVNVAFGREITLAPTRMLVRPGLLEPPDGRGREPAGILAEQCDQRLLEITGGDALQVENRDQYL